jgi:tetratricopeptide (TPR) repeat protein
MSLRTSISVGISVAIFFLSATVNTSAARDSWVSVRSKELIVIGNSGEKEVRLVAARLQQFRQIVSKVFATVGTDSPVPTTVIVFKDDASYAPFKVSENNAGFFQPGRDVNYITLSYETRGEQDQVNITFHEYTHLLVNNSLGNTPAWFNEGLAELYSTLSIKADNRVTIGLPIRRHVATLRDYPLLPLRVLLNLDYKSAYYNEVNKQSIFYAESWALLHYLMFSNSGRRAGQVVKFIELLGNQTPMEQAFQTAFSSTFESIETELRSYIQQDRFRFTETTVTSEAQPDTAMESSSVSEAEIQAYLGDLLFHSNRAEAENHLKKALSLNPHQLLALGSLGMMRFKQGRISEALEFLQRAVAADSNNVLVLYDYASALCRPNSDDPQLTLGFAPEVAAKARAALRKAIALRPDFPDSYNLLAYINLVTSTDIDQTTALLQEVSARSPNRIGFIYMLGQLYMHRDDYKRARPLLEKVVAGNVEPTVRGHAQNLLATMTSIEERQKEVARRGPTSNEVAAATGAALNQSTDPWSDLRAALRTPAQGEKQVQGTLQSIDCDSEGLIFAVGTNGRTLRLKTATFKEIRRTTYTADVKGTLTCGARKPENPVVVCYLPILDKRTKVDGILSSVEFVPPDFRLTPPTP